MVEQSVVPQLPILPAHPRLEKGAELVAIATSTGSF